MVHIGSNDVLGDVVVGEEFQPDCLPDTGGTGVETARACRADALLTAWYGNVRRVVVNLHINDVFADDQSIGDVEVEARITADVLSDLLFIDINCGLKVTGTKVQQNTTADKGGAS